MGAINFSLDLDLIKTLKNVLPLEIFVETGTFKGDTVELVKDYFNKIYSIELSHDYYQKAQTRFQNAPHITLMQGQSHELMHTLMDQIQNRPTIFWLDAHWCVAENTAGELSQCPLLAELATIPFLNPHSMIIIDDARLFLTPPPIPHEVTHWPRFADIMHSLLKLSQQHTLTILNDCILFFPISIQTHIEQYACQKGVDWLNIADKSRDYDVLLKQLIEKEAQIQLLNKICIERQHTIDLLTKSSHREQPKDNPKFGSRNLSNLKNQPDDSTHFI